MYAIQGNSMCPFLTFSKYVSKLHKDLDIFWQKPKKLGNVEHSEWYDKVAVGKNTLGNMMKTLSEKAQLSKQYTNHCLRVTSITELDK